MKRNQHFLYFVEKLEWESLQQKYEIEELSSPDSLPLGTEKIEIYRDESYSINMKIMGRLDDPNEMEHWLKVWNPVAENSYFAPSLEFKLSGVNNFNYNLILSGCYFQGSRSFPISRNHHTSIRYPFRFEAAFSISKVCKTPKKPSNDEYEQSEWLTEWYLNSPREDFYSRLTKRDFTEEYKRIRIDLEEKSFKFPPSSNYNVDHSFIQLEDFSFLIHSVPENLAPNWSKCLGIEYRKEWGKIPEFNERKASADIVSFIAGRQLLNVGFTEFDRAGFTLEEVTVNPPYSFKYNVKDMCQSLDSQPIKLRKYIESEEKYEIITETVLQQLLPKFLSFRSKLSLDKSIQSYWLFKELPIGRNIPTLSAGIETLADAWFSANNLKKEGKYLSGKDFKKLLKEELDLIRKKLENIVNGNKILENIEKSYQFYFGPGKVLNSFLDGINLPINKLEEEAIRTGRNKMAHSTVDFSNEEESRKMYILSKVYETLFNRIMLKILDYEGMYIDYSSFELPERHINEPTGGSSD